MKWKIIKPKYQLQCLFLLVDKMPFFINYLRIDLLNDALKGKNLRHAILNFLWGGLFTEMWIKNQQTINN